MHVARVAGNLLRETAKPRSNRSHLSSFLSAVFSESSNASASSWPDDTVITTGTFTADAQREASRDGAPPIELVDGAALIAMLERLEIGLKPAQTYQPDYEFFQEFQKKTDA